MPSPVKVLAEEHGLPVFQPASLRPQENQQLVADLNADVMVVVAYGLILPKRCLICLVWVVSTCTAPCSALAWCGTYPALPVGGDAETGVTIMKMDVGLDTGDMLHKLAWPYYCRRYQRYAV